MGLYEWLGGPIKKIFREPKTKQSGARFTCLGNSANLTNGARRLLQAGPPYCSSACLRAGVQGTRRTSLVVLAFAVLISSSPAGLADFFDAPNQFAILGVGSAPCTSVIRDVGQTAQVRETDRQAVLAWAQGYLSFYNSVSEGTYDVTGGVGAAGLQEWLFEFCRQNPQASLMNAVDELLVGGAPHRFLKNQALMRR